MAYQPGESQAVLEKWQLGMERLTKSETEPALLGLAMSSLHGALEDRFRHILSSLPQLSEAERSRVQDLNQVKWLELRDLMQKYAGLSNSDAKYIMKMNSLRNEAAHGGDFRGSYQDVAAYADFVKRWLGSVENAQVQVSRSFLNRCPCCQGMNLKSLAIIHRQGISVIERGKGKTETRQSGLSLQTAPPQKKRITGLVGLWVVAVAVFGFHISTFIVEVFNSIPLIGRLLAFVVRLICLAVLLLVASYPIYKIWRFNKIKHPSLMEEWHKTFMCEQCGHTFPLETSK